MIEGIDIVFLHVRDPVKMGDWYKEMLGVDIGFQTPNRYWQEFQLPAGRPVTRFAVEYTGEHPSEIEEQKIMISFRVKDIHAAISEFEAKGVQFYGEQKVIREGLSLFATFRDPEGNWLQISQRVNTIE
jgi:catechol 2,3-dioxygenase-like lactoylglutathione lyase family enzyme